MKNFYKKGFTLIEIIIALFIFAIIAVIVSTALYTIFNARADTKKVTDRLNQLQIAMTILQRDFTQAISRPIRDEMSFFRPAMLGTKHTLVLTRTGYVNPLNLQRRSHLQRVGYFFKENKLIRKTWPHLDRVSTNKPNERILLDKVKGIEIQYLSQTTVFFERWPVPLYLKEKLLGKKIKTTFMDIMLVELPRAIKMKIILEDLDELELLFPLRLGALRYTQ